MHDWFDHILYATRAQPEASAMLMEDRVITYGMLGDAINSCAHRIAALTLAPDLLVAVCIDNPIRHMAVSLALFRVGIRALSIDRGHSRLALQPAAILGDDLAAPAFASRVGFVEVTEDWFAPDPSVQQARLPPQFSGEARIARHSLTSGSTGMPKVLDHSVGALGRSISSTVGFSNCGLVLCMPGLSSVFGFRIACGALASRKTLCFATSPYQAIRMIELFGIDMLYTATEQLVALARVARKTGAHLRSLRTTVVAGGIPTRALLEAAAVHLCKNIVCRYGTSELGVLAEATASNVLQKPGLIGFALPGFEMAAFTVDGHACAPGEMGIVKARVKPNPDRGEDAWTDHGDVGWVSAEGEIYVVGRTSDIGPGDFGSQSGTRRLAGVRDRASRAAGMGCGGRRSTSGRVRRCGAPPEIWVATVDCGDARPDVLEEVFSTCVASQAVFACSMSQRFREARPARSSARNSTN